MLTGIYTKPDRNQERTLLWWKWIGAPCQDMLAASQVNERVASLCIYVDDLPIHKQVAPGWAGIQVVRKYGLLSRWIHWLPDGSDAEQEQQERQRDETGCRKRCQPSMPAQEKRQTSDRRCFACYVVQASDFKFEIVSGFFVLVLLHAHPLQGQSRFQALPVIPCASCRARFCSKASAWGKLGQKWCASLFTASSTPKRSRQ